MKNNIENITSKYDITKNKLQEQALCRMGKYDEELVCLGLKSFNNLKGNERVLSFIEKVDKLYKHDILHRDHITFYGMILFDKKNEFTNKLSDDALMLFCHSYEMNYNDIDSCIESCSSEVLETICKKTNDVSKRFNLYCICDGLLPNKDRTNENISDVCDKITHMDDEQYKLLYDKYCSSDAFLEIAESEEFKNINI